VDLTSPLGPAGYAIRGTEANAQVGAVVAGLGDVNGDHRADVLVTAPSSTPLGRTGAGSAYVVFGQQGSDISLDQLGPHGYAIYGPAAPPQAGGSFPTGLGASAAADGDVNHDHIPDVVLSSPASPAAIAYVVYGQPSSTAAIDLGAPNAPAQAIDGPHPADPASGPLPVARGVNFDGAGDRAIVAPREPGSSDAPVSAYFLPGGP
jgi:hypothetical protein